ncbi:sigma-54 dependent transcriptional regulator [Candidatus Deferrimicrobium sp.]|uniref:sigma-54-dependent transcriptional regulator n=1 Tax=Candidatus Deferrimicrobium sp. TaxID=3060586 RepID=UPI0027244296|nr:sigma-54 dependent transcriptional regulator [Candidatus Deferrimicrobium sp.]MDO8738868.1 sigma-54 dependent transcriptional regulator [Candidatus Deferrimicrobium sp.]
MKARILVVDDERAIRDLFSEALREAGHEVLSAGGGEEASAILREENVQIAICDIKMPGMDGLELLRHIRDVSPETVVILITAYASVETAVNALRNGAFDYFLKPLIFEDIIAKISRIDEYLKVKRENQNLRQEVEARYDFQNMIAKSRSMDAVFGMIRKVSATASNVLITGESGTGKEMIARAIHFNSLVREGKFLPVNCGAIPTTLWESEILGYTRGAFTGATRDKEGYLQVADGGTLFLDEITEMPPEAQVKLLRVIEEQEFTPLGSVKTRPLNARIIAASNQDMGQELGKGKFRSDLYYRLNVVHIEVPPLRERKEDIPALVRHLVSRYNRELGKKIQGVDNATMRLLLSHAWKGNVRELKNAVERAMIFCDRETIGVDDLPAELHGAKRISGLMSRGDLKQSVKEFEKISILSALEETGYDKRHAAALLGLSKSSLYRKIEELEIELSPDESRDQDP